ncbi:hypothetical protein KGV52_00395 [Candidatus Gracilibacteria bacterium]|nr:hypothetical protein [Candidatus Gracilibacteria bacterium]MBS9775151.1 hypothetical protein [Candidatus Gracilibacteria bacterium]
MTTATFTGTEKKSFTIKKDYAKKLNLYKNKSKIVNEALKMYFARQQFLEEKEEEFFNSFEFEDFSKEELDSLVNSKENQQLNETLKNK